MRVYDPTTSTLSVSWEHALGPVVQYVITYAPTPGDPIEEHVSTPPPPPLCSLSVLVMKRIPSFLKRLYVKKAATAL